MERGMISLTAREFEAVSSALLEVLVEARREKGVTGARAWTPSPRQDKRPGPFAPPALVRVH